MAIQTPNIEKHYEILELLFNTMPYVFWKDRSGKYQGGNLNQAINMGFKSPAEFIGKTIYEILKDKGSAKLIDETDNRIMKEGVPEIKEETIVGPKGERTYLSQKSPIFNSKGEVIGLLGFAMDITEIKRQELAVKKERDRLLNIAAQVAHDIKSPTASILMLAKACQDIPEKERISLREAAMTIQDIANNLLNEYKPKGSDTVIANEQRESLLASTIILQILSEKILQYSGLPVKFNYAFDQAGSFAFIKMQPTAFKRMLSNLINNAVDALENKEGLITIQLHADKEWVKVIIEDNGKGMSSEVIDKIKNNITISEGKKDGHGIGLLQVREALEKNQGELEIESQLNKGTKIILIFPRLSSPAWVAKEIKISNDDIIVILDDDASIHGAWDSRFEKIKKQAKNLEIKHFKEGAIALDYLVSLPNDKREKVFLLTDYELLKQELNGLDVVAKGKVQRSVLVTSHYANKEIVNRAAATGTKILPKLLAPEIPIILENNPHHESTTQIPDLVIVDDDANMVEILKMSILSDKIVDHYQDPQHFLNNISKYPKDTKISLDNTFSTGKYTGLSLAQMLHEQGYTQLYLLSGKCFRKEEVPDYLTVILKDDINKIKEIVFSSG